ncbi:hypothetical protein AMATHDRAFT_130838, partial [Amanita thiersii Skay4041]
VNYEQDDWANWLSIAKYQYNDKIHSAFTDGTTGETPFFLNYGRHPWKGDIKLSMTQNESAKDFAKQLQSVCSHARQAMEKTIQKMTYQDDSKNKLKIGDKVWLEATNI